MTNIDVHVVLLVTMKYVRAGVLPMTCIAHRQKSEESMTFYKVHPEVVAQKFHEVYERLAPEFGHETRKESAKPWAEVPEKNKQLMTTVCAQMMIYLSAFDPPMMDHISMESGVSVFDGHPFVTLYYGKEKGQLSPAEIREHAKHLLACAEAAETDALLFRMFGDDEEFFGTLITAVRNERFMGWPDRQSPPKDIVDET